TGSITIPTGTPYGDYRLRIRSRSDYGTIATPCGELSYSEAEDYTVSVVPVPTCIPPNGLAVDGVSFNTADISWMSTGTLFDVEFGETGFTPTGNPSPGYAGITNPYVTLTGLDAETDYQFYVRQDCGDDDTSIWAGQISFYTGYCQVTSTSVNYGISNFVTTGGVTNISNASGPGSYSNYTDQVVSQFEGGDPVTFTITAANGTTGMGLWIDWNNDMDFNDPEEHIFTSNSYVSSATGTIVIPAGTPLGSYRMRVVNNWLSTNPTPCGDLGNASYGEAEDYTFMVIAPPTCMPPSALTHTQLSMTSAELSWTSDGTLFDIEWGLAGFTPTGNPTPDFQGVGSSVILTGLTVDTNYQYYVRRDCGDEDGTSMWVGPYTFSVGYCIPTFVNDCSSGDTIDNFVMADAGINHIGSGCSPNNYGDFTNEPTLAGTMIVGETYDFEITHQYDFNQWVSIWIDLNSNGTFDADELLFTSSTYIENGITTGSITIHANAPTGTFRMRVLNHYGNYTENACAGANYGETHDYTVTITSPADPCDGITTPTGAS